MSEHEDQERAAQQARALDVHRPAGALMRTEYLHRTQEVVAVNRSDLEDIKTFDDLERLFIGVGLFLSSGSTWLFVDKAFSAAKWEFTPVIAISAVSILVGVFLLVVGWRMGKRRRDKIDRIFSETRPAS